MKALASEIIDAVLDAMPIARLALLDPDDRPEALPIVFARVGPALWSPIDGKPKRSGAHLGRLARLQRAPQVMLVVDHYSDDWSELWWIRLKGEAEIVFGKHPDWLPATEALGEKYPQYQAVAMFKDEPTMIRLPWRAISWWAADGERGIERWLQDWAPRGHTP